MSVSGPPVPPTRDARPCSSVWLFRRVSGGVAVPASPTTPRLHPQRPAPPITWPAVRRTWQLAVSWVVWRGFHAEITAGVSGDAAWRAIPRSTLVREGRSPSGRTEKTVVGFRAAKLPKKPPTLPAHHHPLPRPPPTPPHHPPQQLLSGNGTISPYIRSYSPGSNLSNPPP